MEFPQFRNAAVLQNINTKFSCSLGSRFYVLTLDFFFLISVSLSNKRLNYTALGMYLLPFSIFSIIYFSKDKAPFVVTLQGPGYPKQKDWGKYWSHIPYWSANFDSVVRGCKGHTWFKDPRTIIGIKDLWVPFQFALGPLLTYHTNQSTLHTSLKLCSFSEFVNMSHDKPEENRFLPHLCVPYPESHTCWELSECNVFPFPVKKYFGEWCQQNGGVGISSTCSPAPPTKHEFELLSSHENILTRAKDSRWGITVLEWSTEIRKDALRRVGKIDSHYPITLPSSHGCPARRKIHSVWEKSEMSTALRHGPWSAPAPGWLPPPQAPGSPEHFTGPHDAHYRPVPSDLGSWPAPAAN